MFYDVKRFITVSNIVKCYLLLGKSTITFIINEQEPPLHAKISTDIFLLILNIPGCEQFSESKA